jgi:hypothetical protein
VNASVSAITATTNPAISAFTRAASNWDYRPPGRSSLLPVVAVVEAHIGAAITERAAQRQIDEECLPLTL